MEKQFYIGVKIVEAWPEERNGYEGYGVRYEDGYTSWSPKAVFEKAYFPMGDDSSKITEDMVDAFLGNVSAVQLDDKTTMAKSETLTGFVQYEVSSCVDPINYDYETGKNIAIKRIKETLWECLGFVLQWGRFGLKK